MQFCNFRTTDILCQTIICCGGWAVHRLGTSLACTRKISIAPSQLWQPSMPPDIAKYLLGVPNHLQLRTSARVTGMEVGFCMVWFGFFLGAQGRPLWGLKNEEGEKRRKNDFGKKLPRQSWTVSTETKRWQSTWNPKGTDRRLGHLKQRSRKWSQRGRQEQITRSHSSLQARVEGSHFFFQGDEKFRWRGGFLINCEEKHVSS